MEQVKRSKCRQTDIVDLQASGSQWLSGLPALRFSRTGLFCLGVTLGLSAMGAEIEEVVVTAQKRAESVQDVGLSITAFSEQDIEAYGMNNAWDLSQHSPNLKITAFFENSRPEIVIRGVGQNNTFGSIDQSPAGVYNDEVYMGARAAMLTQMFDLERVEVLRGPQGTLYGRNTTGGAINFISKKPSFEAPSLAGTMTYGRFDQIEGELAGGIALSDTVAVRAAGIYRTNDGYTKNQFTDDNMNDLESGAGRVQLAWKPISTLDVLFNVHGSSAESDSPAIHHIGYGNNEPNLLYPVFGGPAYQETNDSHTLSNDRPGFEDNEGWGASMHADLDWNSLTLTTIVSYENVDTAIREDSDGSPVDYFTIDYDDKFDSWSVEQRVASTVEGGILDGLDWVAGFYFYTDEVDTFNHTRLFADALFAPFFGPGGIQGFSTYTQESNNWALFGDFQYPLTEQLQLNGGIRYTYEEKDFDWVLADNFGTSIPIIESEDWDAFTGRAALEWRPLDDMLLYASYARGFKSGGFNGTVLFPPAPTTPDLTFDPEYADAYEIGAKSMWLDQRLVINAALFRIELTDQQTLLVLPGNIFTIRNAAKSIINGAEIEMQLQATEALYMQAALGLLDAEYDKFINPDGRDLSGNPLPAAPDVTFNGLIEYAFAAWAGTTVTPRFEWSYTDALNFDRYGKNRIDSVFGTPIPSAVDIQQNYWLLNASLTWRSVDEKYSVMGWVHNLGDQEYWVKTIGNFADAGSGGGATAYPGPARAYGVTFRFNFD